MTFPYILVCQLLEECHQLCVARKPHRKAVERWFSRHRSRINAHDTDLCALLSTLLPDKRSDRVYMIQSKSLEGIFGRGQNLGRSRMLELRRYRQPGSGIDMAECVEHILSVTPNPILSEDEVTVEEIDKLLHALASKIKWSSPSIRASQTHLSQGDRGDLGKLYQRVTALEAKWLTRLVLKSYAPLLLDQNLVLQLCDPLLPSVLKIRQDFTSALGVVQSARTTLLPNSGKPEVDPKALLARIKPQLGVKIGRQHWAQARSIKHCLSYGNGPMSVEHKVDGEYCQIHVDMSKGEQCIQIFSKSGKDSTEDRQGLHEIIKESLAIDTPGCVLSQGCILEGELVVYSDIEEKILPFHKIRNHVTRRGRYLNTDYDIRPTRHEHLMLVYFDVLFLDQRSLLNTRHSERFKVLESLIQQRKGWAELVPREIINFGHSMAASNLRKAFATTIVNKQEGLVLKPDEPFFNFDVLQQPWCGRCIKLKKEYIGSFGDVGDFAVVGAGYDPVRARDYKSANLKWTHFYIGCLNNKEEVTRWSATPDFTVVNMVSLNEAQLLSVTKYANPTWVPRGDECGLTFKLIPEIEKGPDMTMIFPNPMVFDLRCFSFDKPGNTGFWSLRFPAVSKIHFDRDFTDSISFDELQEMAKAAHEVPEQPDSQENLHWIAKLEGADPRGIAVDIISQRTGTTEPTPSPRRRLSSPPQSCPTSPTYLRPNGKDIEMPSSRVISSQGHARVHYAEKPTPDVTTTLHSIEEAVKENTTVESRKRGTSQDEATQAQKKPKRNRTESAGPNSCTSKGSQKRQPLASINANSSQRSATSVSRSSPFEHPSNKPSQVIDLTSSPDRSSQTAASIFDSSQPREIPSSQTEDVGALVEDSEERQEMCSQRSPKNACRAPSVLNRERHDESSLACVIQGDCAYAGEQCQFVDKTVLLTPQLVKKEPSLESLLNAHGITDPVTEVKEWMMSRTDSKSAFLLVDSMNNRPEMEKLLGKISRYRSFLPAERDDWVTIYDWRVLKYITIMEDWTITKKYYDGFKDPWRRWYCGLA